MTLLLLGAGFSLPVLAAYAAIRGSFPDASSRLGARALEVGLAIPLGLGASSLLAYGWLLAAGALVPRYPFFDAAVFAGLAAAAFRFRPMVPALARAQGRGVDRLAALGIALAGAALLLAAATFVLRTSADSCGGGDAWATWNLKARFLLRSGDQWRLALDPRLADFSHVEYPFLLPAAIARLWAYAGESAVAPLAIAGAFALATVLVVFGAVARRAGVVPAAAATLALLATAAFQFEAGTQYADVPLTCLIAAAAAALLDAPGDGGDRRRALVLAGALLGLAAWTKEEGVVLAVLFGAWAAALRPPEEPMPLARRVGWLSAGALVPIAARVHFQIFLSPGFSADFSRQNSLGASIARLFDLERWNLILTALPRHVPGAEVWLPAVAIGAAALLGATWRGAWRTPVLPAAATYLVFLFVYAVSPYPLRWYIRDSAARVLLQPWPALLLGLFALVPRPGGAARVPLPSDGG